MSEASSFTNDDRRMLYELNANVGQLRRDFDDQRAQLRNDASPTAGEFSEVKGKVEQLDRFRWYIMGIAAASGAASSMFIEFLKTRP